MFERILVPLDGSELAEWVLPLVKELSRTYRAEVTLLQVVSAAPAMLAMEGASGVMPDPTLLAAQLDADAQEAEIYLERMAAGWQVAEASVRWRVERGVAGEQIVDHARAHGVNLIAMSTHGRSGLSRLVFGSVADQVLRSAGVPILLVRPETSDRPSRS